MGSTPPTLPEKYKISTNPSLINFGNQVYSRLLAQISSLWILLFGAFQNMLPTEQSAAWSSGKYRADDQHDLCSKPILLCSWKRHFTALSPGWWS